MTRSIAIATAFAVLATTAAAEPVPVRVTGSTQADNELLQDIVQHVTLFGAAFNCPAPSRIQIATIDPARVPARAEYNVKADGVLYEDWEAEFCGKTHSFLISFWPDPNGGSFLKVSYPYPPGAPKGSH